MLDPTHINVNHELLVRLKKHPLDGVESNTYIKVRPEFDETNSMHLSKNLFHKTSINFVKLQGKYPFSGGVGDNSGASGSAGGCVTNNGSSSAASASGAAGAGAAGASSSNGAGSSSVAGANTNSGKMPAILREFVGSLDDREWQSDMYKLLQAQSFNQVEVDLFELLCKVLDHNLFAQVDWARNSYYFKELKVSQEIYHLFSHYVH